MEGATKGFRPMCASKLSRSVRMGWLLPQQCERATYGGLARDKLWYPPTADARSALAPLRPFREAPILDSSVGTRLSLCNADSGTVEGSRDASMAVLTRRTADAPGLPMSRRRVG